VDKGTCSTTKNVKEKTLMSSQQNVFVKWGAWAITIVAGVWTLFHLIWGIAGQTNDDYWGISLLILFALSLLLAFITFFQQRTALQSTTSNERFPEPALAKFSWPPMGPQRCGLWSV